VRGFRPVTAAAVTRRVSGPVLCWPLAGLRPYPTRYIGLSEPAATNGTAPNAANCPPSPMVGVITFHAAAPAPPARPLTRGLSVTTLRSRMSSLRNAASPMAATKQP
jgi:hypothetical protein